jgi:capsular polysaccharide biosynthesis protein
VDILELVLVAWRGKWLVAGISLVAIIVMFVLNYIVPTVPIYEETAQVQLTAGNNFGRSVIVGRILHSDEFVATVSAQITGYTDEELYTVSQLLLAQQVVRFETVVDGRPVVLSEVVDMTIEGTDPELIHVWITTALAELQRRSEEHYAKRREIRESYLNSLREQISLINLTIEETENQLASLGPSQGNLMYSLNTQLADLLERREQAISAEYALAMELVEDQPYKVLRHPRLQTDAVPARFLRPNLFVAAILGIFLGIVVVFTRDYFQALISSKTQ